MVNCRHALYLLLALVLAPAAMAAYRPLTMPDQWAFAEKTPAYHPENSEKLGDFQAGLRVAVLEQDLDGGTWLVEYRAYGREPIRARIPIPDLSKAKPREFARIQEDIESFPLLQKQLESGKPWNSGLPAMADRLFREEAVMEDGDGDSPLKLVSAEPAYDGMAWQLMPVKVMLDASIGSSPRIIIDYWSKGDSKHSTVDPRSGNETLSEKLELIEKTFGTGQGMYARRQGASSGITALANDATHYFLPNDIRATLRYSNGEYLILELSSYRSSLGRKPNELEDEALFAQLRGNVAITEDGDRYVSNIPMISQGDKGYCAAATLARVLSYYGYPVDMHAVAKLAETERYGTTRENAIRSMRRVCSSTPFRMKELRDTDRESIFTVIERGLPIIWLVPGHARLLIGINPDEDTIVFSDSWGPDFAFQTMPYDKFIELNEGMYILEPQE